MKSRFLKSLGWKLQVRSLTNSTSIPARIPLSSYTSMGLTQQGEAQRPPRSHPFFRDVVAAPGASVCCLEGGVGFGAWHNPVAVREIRGAAFFK